MTLHVTHAFVSGKGDGPDSTLVRPSAVSGGWNADHKLVTDAVTPIVLGRQTPGAGVIEELPLSVIFPSGVVVDFAGTTAPPGWLLCYGQVLLQADYPSLFAAIGTTYGAGPGPATFLAPDLRGVVVGGKSNMGGADRGNLPAGGVLGQYMGAWAVGVGFTSSGTNNIDYGNLGLTQTSGTITQATATAGAGNGAGPLPGLGDAVGVTGYIRPNGNFSISVNGSTTADVRQPTVILNKIIKT